MRQLLERAAANDFAVYPHSEVFELTRGGHMHEGAVSRELGLKGMPAEGESAMNARDIELVRKTRGRLHILHLSVKRAAELVRQAKAEDLPVTCEASPHHIVLTDEDVRILGTAGKMSPPLRAREDREAIIAGLQDGTIDALATDHAPHTTKEKLGAFTQSTQWHTWPRNRRRRHLHQTRPHQPALPLRYNCQTHHRTRAHSRHQRR